MLSKNILGGLLTAGLLAMGCGGAEPGMDEQAALDTREDAQLFCSQEAFDIVYYSDATLTTPVGHWYCECFETAWQFGRKTQFKVVEYSRQCQ
ncbi:DUF6289 family protein [Myxococcus landrumensis]|uniref:Lipoprotein n=1 Tax=Myxococcus landrumensis TaxID=2813577 RepID=A0ABX7N1W3_9BACT|nr:DUF6289 family protein [Myxococcus landrumus]QSQ12478.1 hypothetical protein JY572_29535 [Myxococcus landrumus]